MLRVLLVCLLVSLPATAAACGGGEDPEPPPEPVAQQPSQEDSAESTAAPVEAAPDEPFTLAEGQAVPPDFRAAYERGSPLVVQFYEQDEMSFYPQGLGVDGAVDDAIRGLQQEYPDVEFFSYDIDDPGEAQNSAGLELGRYGTLAAQLGVGFTPYVAMLAPRDEGYVYESVFRGYTTPPVLEQALSDLADTSTTGSDESAELVLEQAETTAEGGLELVTVGNEGEERVDLGGYELTAVDPATGEAAPDSGSLTIDGEVSVEPGASVSLGRAPEVEDAEGDRVDGTFGGDPLNLEPGDQVALVGPDGAVAATFTL